MDAKKGGKGESVKITELEEEDEKAKGEGSSDPKKSSRNHLEVPGSRSNVDGSS